MMLCLCLALIIRPFVTDFFSIRYYGIRETTWFMYECYEKKHWRL